jgi:hypothetical protein
MVLGARVAPALQGSRIKENDVSPYSTFMRRNTPLAIGALRKDYALPGWCNPRGRPVDQIGKWERRRGLHLPFYMAELYLQAEYYQKNV